MKFLKKLFRKQEHNQKEEQQIQEKQIPNVEELKKSEIQISRTLDENIKVIEDAFTDCDDIVYKEFSIGPNLDTRVAIIYADGLIDKTLITENVTKALMQQARGKEPEDIKTNLYQAIKEGNLSAPELKDIKTIEEAIDGILSGDTVLLIEGYEKIIVIDSKGWTTRGLQEPQTEALVRGPRDGFNETVKIGMSLVRRRIRDTKLKVKMMQVGRRSKTDIAILYIEDIADKRIVDEVKKRIEKIDIDAILESSYIEGFIEDNNFSLFPQIQNTERPDMVASSLYEGRVAILIDNTPFALIVPVGITAFFESSEDYYERWILSIIVRPVRYLAALISILAPALYIAITSYHPGILPTGLALYVAATRVAVPFPAFLEAFMMQLTVEFIRESGTRISGPIGTTIGIVGGLVIGQAAVEAGVVSPLMVIIAALTTIATFMTPNYSFSITLRVLGFIMMILASTLGLYGIMLGLIAVGIHLSRLTSYGVPYMSPYSVLGKYSVDLKDSIIRIPFRKIKTRPHYGRINDPKRTE